MQKEKYIKAVDMRNNRVVFISEARWPEYRASGWFDRVDNVNYVYVYPTWRGGLAYIECLN